MLDDVIFVDAVAPKTKPDKRPAAQVDEDVVQVAEPAPEEAAADDEQMYPT